MANGNWPASVDYAPGFDLIRAAELVDLALKALPADEDNAENDGWYRGRLELAAKLIRESVHMK